MKLKRILSLTLALLFTLSVMTVPANAAETDTPLFTDVPADAWYSEAVNVLASKGIMKGDGNGHFYPNKQVTYGELVTVLMALYGYENVTTPEYLMAKREAGLNMSDWTTAYGKRIVTVLRNDIAGVFDDSAIPSETPVHWAATANLCANNTILDGAAMEDLDVPAIRGSAIAYVTIAALHMRVDKPAYVHDYELKDIADWEDILGVEHTINFQPTREQVLQKDMEPYSKTLYVWPIDDELHFLPDAYVCQVDDSSWYYPNRRFSDYGYNQSTIAANNLDGQTYVQAHPDLILRAYNLGLITGIDAKHTCNIYGRLTRAELAVMLYRAGLTDKGICRVPASEWNYKGTGRYEGRKAEFWDKDCRNQALFQPQYLTPDK